MGTRVRVALLQLAAFDLANAARALHHTLARIDEATRSRPDLLVLPEMTYPAYYLGGPWPDDAPPPTEALAALQDRARRHGVYIAAGIALETANGGLENGAAFIGPDGALIGTYAKSFLWHFDRHWFERGDRYPVFETPFGRAGLLVCADARLPEVGRLLALGGASLLIDCTAWVSWGRSTGELTSPQPEYMLRVRARENGVWAVAADKVGVEADSIVYCGRSCAVAPDGSIAAMAPPDREETVVVELDLDTAPGFPVERRPELYGRLRDPAGQLPALAASERPEVVARNSRRVAAVSLTARSSAAYLDDVEHYARLLGRQDVDLAVFSPPAGALPVASAEALARLRAGLENGPLLALPLEDQAEGGRYRAMYLLGKQGVLGRHRQTHLAAGERERFRAGDAAAPVVDAAGMRIGLLAGSEALAPEPARCLMLEGADVLAWSFGPDTADALPLARCRADENRVYIAAAGPPSEGAVVVAPDGHVLASSLLGREMAVSAQVNPALTRWKDMAPGTNVLLDRQPESYGPLASK